MQLEKRQHLQPHRKDYKVYPSLQYYNTFQPLKVSNLFALSNLFFVLHFHHHVTNSSTKSHKLRESNSQANHIYSLEISVNNSKKYIASRSHLPYTYKITQARIPWPVSTVTRPFLYRLSCITEYGNWGVLYIFSWLKYYVTGLYIYCLTDLYSVHKPSHKQTRWEWCWQRSILPFLKTTIGYNSQGRVQDGFAQLRVNNSILFYK